MARSMIRFSCVCGKTLAADSRHAGRKSTCPRCKRSVEVPFPPDPPAGSEAVPLRPAGKCRHPRLDEFYAAVLSERGEAIDHHEVDGGRPTIRFRLPPHRRQSIRLDVVRDEKGRELLAVESEIGTVTTFEETAKALQMNRKLEGGRLFLDDTQLLLIEARARLEELDRREVLAMVDEVSRRADEFEEALFGIDVR